MSFCYFIGFICIAFLICESIIANVGWIYESKRREKNDRIAEDLICGLIEENLKLQDKLNKIESWESIKKANEGVDSDVD